MSEEYLDAVAFATEERDKAMQAAEQMDALWRVVIRKAVEDGAPVADIAAVAGISRQRVYQIRDGKR